MKFNIGDDDHVCNVFSFFPMRQYKGVYMRYRCMK